MSKLLPSGSIPDKDQEELAVPTLRVMRLQSPEIHQNATGSIEGYSSLEQSLCLPDSLDVYVGERFAAYLGILNTSTNSPIRRLTVTAQLQTPSQRWQLPSQLDAGNLMGGVDIDPLSGIDAIVTRTIDEPGQHILRVEVGYLTNDGGSKSFRKFYRFQVTAPFTIRHSISRWGDSCCYISVDVEYNIVDGSSNHTNGPLVIRKVALLPADGLVSELLSSGLFSESTETEPSEEKNAIELYDDCNIIMPGGSYHYLFRVVAQTKEAILRGIAADDLLGRAVLYWCKAMGESGECFSAPIYCPPVDPAAWAAPTGGHASSTFVVHRSGLSVDVASAAATQSHRPDRLQLLAQLPVTVEPIDPPTRMKLNIPQQVQFLVVNHSEQPMTLQLQLHLSKMAGLVVCGPSFLSLGEISPRGGSTVVAARFLPLAPGLYKVDGCVVLDLVTGREVAQPPLFYVFVEKSEVGYQDD